MKLEYSFGSVPTQWIDGPPPVSTKGVERIRIDLKGSSDGPFPPVFPVEDLLHRIDVRSHKISTRSRYCSNMS